MADNKTAPQVKGKAYPSKRFGPNGETRYVEDEAADRALGPGWHDRPQPAPDVRQKRKE